MHNFLHTLIPMLFGMSLIPMAIIGIKNLNWARQRKKLTEIEDAPFPFTVRSGNNNYYIIFDLGDGMKLWCDYSYGIREDGLYGVDWMKLEGWNSWYETDIEMKIGQSVFPLVENMEKLTAWLDAQPFEYEWDKTLREKWDEMKKKLNNLRYLETKSKEKEKKQK